MYEELVTALQKRAVELPEKFSKNAENIDLLLKAADAIEVLDMKLQGANAAIAGMQREIERMVIDSVNSKPQWIPVDERLPENPGEYLVTYHPCVWNSVTQKVRVGIDSFRGKTAWAKRKYQHVTHWMKFPEPPNNGE